MYAELGTAGALLLAALVLTWVIASGLTRRLTIVSRLMQRLSKGHAVDDIPFQDDRYETGIMARALLSFRDNLTEAEQMRIMQQQLEQDGQSIRHQAIHDMVFRFESSLLGIVKRLNATTR